MFSIMSSHQLQTVSPVLSSFVPFVILLRSHSCAISTVRCVGVYLCTSSFHSISLVHVRNYNMLSKPCEAFAVEVASKSVMYIYT